MNYIQEFFTNFVALFVDMAFYIVVGLFFVGILNTYIKREKVLKHLGTEKFSSVVKASMVGVPLPLCSCGVVPTAMELKKSGASNGAVVSFLVSTPQTGVDSIIATYSLMGPVLAIFRPLAAFASGIISGVAVNLWAKNEKIATDAQVSSCCCASEEEKQEESACCSSETSETVGESCCCSSETTEKVSETCCCSGETIEKVSVTCCCSGESTETVGESCCCSGETTETVGESCCCSGGTVSKKGKFHTAMHYAFCSFLDEISGHFLFGMVLATLIATFVPADFFVSMGLHQGLLAMLAMVLIGLPMYICSTSSIPIAISLVGKGLSVGSAFVFLFTGPVTNIASVVVLGRVLGKKITAMYLGSVIFCSLIFGSLLDFLINFYHWDSDFGGNMAHADNHSHHIEEALHHSEGGFGIFQATALFLFVMLTASFYRKLKNKS